MAEKKEILKTAKAENRELYNLKASQKEYSIRSISGSTSKRRAKGEDITCFPAARDLVTGLTEKPSTQKQTDAKSIAKEQIFDCLTKDLQKFSPEDARRLKERMLVVSNEGENAELLSFAFTDNTLIENKLLLYLAELLYRENRMLGTLSTGTGRRDRRLRDKEDERQLSLFVDIVEKRETSDRSSLIYFNSREVAKNIYNTNDPQSTQIRAVKEALEKLSSKIICSHIGNGLYSTAPLVMRMQGGLNILQPEKGIKVEVMALHPLFTLALKTQGGFSSDREYVLFPPMNNYTNKIRKQIDFNIFMHLHLLRSYASKSIETKAKKGEREKHFEEWDKFIDKIFSGEGERYKEHRKRNDTDIMEAFRKMEELGIIIKGSFSITGGKVVWEWNPDYPNRQTLLS